MAQFHIFCTKKVLDKLFKNISFFPAKVQIWSPKKRLVSHAPIIGNFREKTTPYQNSKKLILGIDPGMETGIAMLSLDGVIVNIFSKKTLSRGGLIDHIIKFGTPVLVCGDVNPLPNFVRKIASIYNATISEPSRLLSHSDKKNLIKNYTSIKINNHELDALSAAVYGYNKYKDKFYKIDNSQLLRKLKEYAKQLIIEGKSVSESIALSEKSNIKPKIEEKPKIQHNYNLYGERIEHLLDVEKRLQETITFYRAEQERQSTIIKNLQITIRSLKGKRKKKENIIIEEQLKSDLIIAKDKKIDDEKKHIMLLKQKNMNLQDRINDLESMVWLSMETGGYPIKILPIFSIDDIDRLQRDKGIKEDDIILILNPTGVGLKAASKLLSINLKMIFYEKNKLPPKIEKIFYNSMIPFIRAEKYAIKKLDTIAIISMPNLDLAIKDYKKNHLKVLATEKSKKLVTTIENYQYERSKEVESMNISYDNYDPDEVIR